MDVEKNIYLYEICLQYNIYQESLIKYIIICNKFIVYVYYIYQECLKEYIVICNMFMVYEYYIYQESLKEYSYM